MPKKHSVLSRSHLRGLKTYRMKENFNNASGVGLTKVGYAALQLESLSIPCSQIMNLMLKVTDHKNEIMKSNVQRIANFLLPF